MSKRFYFLLIVVLSVSVLLLGFSFAKESGSNNTFLNKIDNYDLRVVFATTDTFKLEDEYLNDISIVNKKNTETNYSILIKEVNGKSFNNVYYVLDNGKTKLLNTEKIYSSKLAPLGNNNDQVTHHLKIIAKTKQDLEFKIIITSEEDNLLINHIKNSPNIYQDNQDYRYYGAKVNNYVRYKDLNYQIIGLIDNSIRLISNYENIKEYDALEEYLNITDYLASFNNRFVSKDNVLNYHSWLTSNGDYWLEDTENENAYYLDKENGLLLDNKSSVHGIRRIIKLSDKVVVLRGDGSINNPYEVAYDS